MLAPALQYCMGGPEGQWERDILPDSRILHNTYQILSS